MLTVCEPLLPYRFVTSLLIQQKGIIWLLRKKRGRDSNHILPQSTTVYQNSPRFTAVYLITHLVIHMAVVRTSHYVGLHDTFLRLLESNISLMVSPSVLTCADKIYLFSYPGTHLFLYVSTSVSIRQLLAYFINHASTAWYKRLYFMHAVSSTPTSVTCV